MPNLITAPGGLDVIWVLICTVLVFLMQAGFCLLESGMVRSKNSINVAVKNLLDCVISMLVFTAIGFSVMFGVDVGGLIGEFGSVDFYSDPKLTSFFLFQLVFCSTATTIISGAVAERTRLSTFVLVAVCVSGFVYPVTGHWVWGGTLATTGQGWLSQLGFVDFAGATVVHVVGGFAALAAVLVVGPRTTIPLAARTGGHSLTLAVLGCFLLWFGWWGFNGGSCLSVTDGLPLILLNTQLSAAAGAVGATLVCVIHNKRVEVIPLISGVLSGLVSITAACHAVTPFAAVVVGAVGSILAYVVDVQMKRREIDDVVSAFPVHGICGLWGTLAFGLFAGEELFNGMTRLQAVGIQTMGSLAVAATAFVVVWGLLSLVKVFVRIRVTEGEERLGLNVVEHGATNEVLELMTEMDRHRDGDFSTLVHEEPDTEAGQIACQYNRVLDRVASEMSQREEANEWLKAERLRLKSVLEFAGVGIYQLNEQFQATAANQTLLDILGYRSEAEFVTSTPVTQTSWLVGTENEKLFLDSLTTGVAIRNVETKICNQQGEDVWLLESIVPVKDENDKLVTWLGTVNDITERKQVMLQEVAVAQARSQAKGEFLANMSHEIRTPLNGVIGMLDLLSNCDLSEQPAHFAGVAQNSAHTLLYLINDILDFSKIEAGRMELESIPFDIRELLESTSETFALRAFASGLDLNCDVPPDLPCSVIGDPERIRQVLVNLIGNAIKFTKEGEINLRVNAVGDKLRFMVEDTGIGMTQEQAENMFEAFTQADASTTREYGGTGLGLAISSQLVQLMGGQLQVESAVGVGSRFLFEVNLPTAVREKESNERLRQMMEFLPGTRVLIVDDNATNCEIMKNLVTAWGFDAVICQEPESVVDRLMVAQSEERPFRLMLLDFCMPAMNGMKVADVITECDGIQKPSIILLSSNHEILSSDDRSQHGIDAAMTKPVRQSRLFDSILDVMEGNPHLLSDHECRSKRETFAGESTSLKPIVGDFSSEHNSGARCNVGQHEEAGFGEELRQRKTSPAVIEIERQDTPIGLADEKKSVQAECSESVSNVDVLVVEDNEINQIVVEQMLSSVGYTTQIANHGEEAIQKLREGKYRLVLMDGHMPVMDGIESALEIRRLERTGELKSEIPVPIVALTANASADAREEFIMAGMNDFLTKPLTLARLKVILDKFAPSPMEVG